MARLHVIYDPRERLELDAEAAGASEARQATLDLPDDLADRDIYEVARKLAELLLEQL